PLLSLRPPDLAWIVFKRSPSNVRVTICAARGISAASLNAALVCGVAAEVGLSGEVRERTFVGGDAARYHGVVAGNHGDAGIAHDCAILTLSGQIRHRECRVGARHVHRTADKD